MDVPAEGDVLSFERTFTTEEVRRFADLSGDRQQRHLEPDEEGRLLVHGLLTATLPTKLGGDLSVLAHSMEFVFHAPVYTGDRITCTVTVDSVDEREDRFDVAVSAVCTDDADETVLTGEFTGLIRKRDVEERGDGRPSR
jgi:acyl dehydratase